MSCEVLREGERHIGQQPGRVQSLYCYALRVQRGVDGRVRTTPSPLVQQRDRHGHLRHHSSWAASTTSAAPVRLLEHLVLSDAVVVSGSPRIRRRQGLGVAWQTASEVGTAGFNLYRVHAGSGARTLAEPYARPGDPRKPERRPLFGPRLRRIAGRGDPLPAGGDRGRWQAPDLRPVPRPPHPGSGPKSPGSGQDGWGRRGPDRRGRDARRRDRAAARPHPRSRAGEFGRPPQDDGRPAVQAASSSPSRGFRRSRRPTSPAAWASPRPPHERSSRHASCASPGRRATSPASRTHRPEPLFPRCPLRSTWASTAVYRSDGDLRSLRLRLRGARPDPVDGSEGVRGSGFTWRGTRAGSRHLRRAGEDFWLWSLPHRRERQRRVEVLRGAAAPMRRRARER